MRVTGDRVVIGPKKYIGERPFRSVHLLHEFLDRTMCGTAPSLGKSLIRSQRWMTFEERFDCNCRLIHCSICMRVADTL